MTDKTETPLKTSASKIASSRAWKERNKERVKAYNKKRNDARKADPIAYAKHLAQCSERSKRMRDQKRAYDQARDPAKTKARAFIRNRIYRGEIRRLPCEICGNPKTDAHHDDYSKPAEVRWLCRPHHNEVHHER